MTAPAWVSPLLYWKKPPSEAALARCNRVLQRPQAPNMADVSSNSSLALSGSVLDQLGVTATERPTRSSGRLLEHSVEQDLRSGLALPAADDRWTVKGSGTASDYHQFRHLRDLQRLFKNEPALRTTIGHDYLVKSDVFVGAAHPEPGQRPFLHAAVSCKWTLRSDRAQNVRYEFAILVRNRRGRLPHLVVVTAEPLPSRLISLARGTGEIDAIYHVFYDELSTALGSGTGSVQAVEAEQRGQWNEMVTQGRVRPYRDLLAALIAS